MNRWWLLFSNACDLFDTFVPRKQENNLHWENETKPSFLLDGIESEPNNVHDDASSISSESSCCEDYAEANRKFYKKPSFDWISRHSLQDSDGGALKELPHSESVLDHLAAGNWECNE